MELNKAIKFFEKELKTRADPERAAAEKKYLKSPFKFYGVSMGQRDKIVQEFYKANKDLTKKELWDLCDNFWHSGWHDKRGIAIRLLQLYPKYLDVNALPRIEKMLKESLNWDQVDEISAHLMGAVLEKNFSVGKKYLVKWSKDKNFWLRRASMLSQLLLFRKQKGDLDLFFSFAVPMLEEKNYGKQEFTAPYTEEKMGKFFIRKAIGWVLREISQKNPGVVVDFVNRYKNKMSGLTLREAIRKLPPEFKQKIK